MAKTNRRHEAVRRRLSATLRNVRAEIDRTKEELRGTLAINNGLTKERDVLMNQLKAALNPPSVMRNGKITPIAALTDYELLDKIHETEREGLHSVERYDGFGETRRENRGLISPVYRALLSEGEQRGIIRRLGPVNEMPMQYENTKK